MGYQGAMCWNNLRHKMSLNEEHVLAVYTQTVPVIIIFSQFEFNLYSLNYYLVKIITKDVLSLLIEAMGALLKSKL